MNIEFGKYMSVCAMMLLVCFFPSRPQPMKGTHITQTPNYAKKAYLRQSLLHNSKFPLVQSVDPTSPSLQSQQPHFRQSSCQYMSNALRRYLKQRERSFFEWHFEAFSQNQTIDEFQTRQEKEKLINKRHFCLLTYFLYKCEL